MTVFRSKEYTGAVAWDATSIALMNGITVRMHWTDQPYHWQVNDGEEVFAVLDGLVDMHWREAGVERTALLAAGDVFYAGPACEHRAAPRGEARILVVERDGSD